ncbi:hypothetical protein Pmani_022325 [Petrolisthes manimaculis]|uniref:Coatomer alpha subunit C-terminal domain-containing protein n=1 Tax=Petrolisthes manimaculis TaxID=1843537 RepID=A0AAE1PE95_9EUCA|nr:hypothetical protein Pmani_022325 [Petrolisthes manimaculis]
MPVQWSNYKGGEGEGGWEVEDDLDLPEDLTSGDLMTSGSGQGEEDYFVPSPGGQSVTQGWTQRSQLTIDHILVGSLETACRLLNDQSLKLAALMDRLTLTQAGSSYRHTHSHSSWQLLWTDSLSLKLTALMDRLTLTQAGSSYGQTHSHSS